MNEQSLWDSYADLISYYDIEIERERFFSQKDLINRAKNENCANFIEKHFICGCKDQVIHNHIADRYLNRNMNTLRLVHTVSLYCLGLSMQSMFQGRIADALKRQINGLSQWYHEEHEFKYLWFLTCLFHDAASDIEKIEQSEPRRIVPAEHVKQLLEKQMHTRYGGLHRFPKETVWNYYLYRKEKGEQDHGIIAGAYLFDGLLSSYNYNRKHGKRITSSTSMVKAECAGQERILLVHKDHPLVFGYAADAITSHNMWTTQEGNVPKEYRNNLKELIITDEQRLSIGSLPLHFMLCLLDTIEPTKRFANIPAGLVLQSICICNVENGIRIAWEKKLMRHAEYYSWMNGIQGMQNWMAVYVSSCRCEGDFCSVDISFI